MLNDRPEFRALQKHRNAMAEIRIDDLFAQNSQRTAQFSQALEGLTLDYSHHRATEETMALLCALARACDLEGWRDKMFRGEKINSTENRAVLHTALRVPETETIAVDSENIVPFIHDTLKRMARFSTDLRDGTIKGSTGKAIKTVIAIGIGGSTLGPQMVCEALRPYASNHISVRFVSNIDPSDLVEALKDIDPESCFFLIASKTFTTQETMANAHMAKSWLLNALKDEQAVSKHFAALSTNTKAVTDFGIDEAYVFPFRDWVGGRYSLWSSIGLPICIAAGFENFRALLDGAYTMDKHFRTAPLEQNIPAILGMLGIWYRNFWNAQSYTVAPYDYYLSQLPSWLQQIDMESNGKSVDREGNLIAYETGPVVFGQTGTNGQHAFFQLIHQSTTLIPCEFIAAKQSVHPQKEQHRMLLANMEAQARALRHGQQNVQQPHRNFPGNKPSTTILLDKLDAYHLGMLLSLYEHKIFVQGIVWNINSFDQWGVELGKEIAKQIIAGEQNSL